MSEFKHTPGPWGILDIEPRNINFDEDTRFWVIVDSDGFSPALVPPWDRVEPIAPAEAAANARLIAAAPELLEACESSALALEEAANLLEGHGLKGCAAIMRGHAEDNRAAIAKATGGPA